MGIEVERIDGHDRYAVNAKLAKNKKNADTLVFASGENYADSLSSVGLANKTKSPILLVQKTHYLHQSKSIYHQSIRQRF